MGEIGKLLPEDWRITITMVAGTPFPAVLERVAEHLKDAGIEKRPVQILSYETAEKTGLTLIFADDPNG